MKIPSAVSNVSRFNLERGEAKPVKTPVESKADQPMSSPVDRKYLESLASSVSGPKDAVKDVQPIEYAKHWLSNRGVDESDPNYETSLKYISREFSAAKAWAMRQENENLNSDTGCITQ